MKKHYVKAMVSLLRNGADVDVVLTNVRQVLVNKGHQSLHKQILQEVLNELARTTQSSALQITVAKESDVKRLEESIAKALQTLGTESKDMHITVDETLIGGFTVSHKGTLINASYKDKLVNLYRTITK